ncbi:golgi-dynamics membrane-trafficking domain-containing protein [Phthorimaea operculella]|nr:golgi-dynamics membrane-trafficking domain-containing protein [Phthorimaea operculella]
MGRSDVAVTLKETAAGNGGKLTVGHGETVTVRVPTHHRARALCWEFATDHYDIGRSDVAVTLKETAAGNGGKLTVGHGETVTVRVPTHHRARALCWEFATDHYDIGLSDVAVTLKETAAGNGGKLTVGHGETVTVRVPTHHRARALCWEFATDHYDIGFGLYFEWSKSATGEVTVHVSESDDDDVDEDDGYGDEEVQVNSTGDPELGSAERKALHRDRPPISPVVPVYRRDCHTEVYAGSHTYPGEGVYLLKFDNTYSLWRSKTLYYKVYYTQ